MLGRIVDTIAISLCVILATAPVRADTGPTHVSADGLPPLSEAGLPNGSLSPGICSVDLVRTGCEFLIETLPAKDNLVGVFNRTLQEMQENRSLEVSLSKHVVD
ncbi:MAG: hypothetical protein AAFV19_01715 [Pseudomonadota bacterium]